MPRCTVKMIALLAMYDYTRPTYNQHRPFFSLLSRCLRQRERLNASVLSIYSSVCLSVAKMQKNAIFSKTQQFSDLY